jgi:hypothetical protein
MKPILTPNGYDQTRVEYKLYLVIKFIITHISLDYGLVAFALYDWDRALTVWRSWGYFGHIIPFVILISMPIVQALVGKRHVPTAKKTN